MMRGKVFYDRRQAGRELAGYLLRDPPEGDVIVLGLPRGGIPVACEVARALGAPLDVFVVRKLGAPFNPEYALGAIATGGVVVYNPGARARVGVDELDGIRRREQAELERRERAYRGSRGPLELAGKNVVVVDDGIATGATMRAAAVAIRAAQARAVTVAAPTASSEAVADLERVADRVAVLSVPEPYVAVGAWYEYFPQLSDHEVVALLSETEKLAVADT